MKLTTAEIILSGCIVAITGLLLVTANVEENAISTLEHDKTELKAQLQISDANYQDDSEVISHLLLVQNLMKDGASYTQAEQIISVSEEAGISPK